MCDITIHESDYYHGTEADLFAFIQLPTLFFSDPYYKQLSLAGKVIYSAMRNRMELSVQNKWFDENGRAYIFFTSTTVMEYLDCSKEKTAKVYKELEEFNLIERKKQGFGKPEQIFVLKPHITDVSQDYQNSSDHLHEVPSCDDDASLVRKSNHDKFENRTTTGSKIEH